MKININLVSINSLSFISENIGYYSSAQYGLFKTIDGGLNWSFIANPNVPIEGKIVFSSENIGYYSIYGAKQSSGVYKTTNGGLNWNHIVLGVGEGGFFEMSFIDL